MTKEYHESIRKLQEACVQHNLNGTWGTIAFEDNTYEHFFPIESMTEIEKDPFHQLEIKMGKGEYAALMSGLQQCVASQYRQIFSSIPALSYLTPGPHEIYREMIILTPMPGKEDELEEIWAERKKMYESTKARENYSVFRIIVGSELSYVLMFTARNRQAMFEKRNGSTNAMKNLTMLWEKQMAITEKYYWRRGFILPELSYSVASHVSAYANR